MEVSTVSPSPISPTEGYDLCEIDVTSVTIHIVTLLIGLCGLAGNMAVLWLLQINTIGVFIFDQAIIDILFLIFMGPSTVLILVEELSCTPIIPQMYLGLLFQLSLFSYNLGLYDLMFISIERCRSILCPFFCGCQLNKRISLVVTGALYWAFFFFVIAVNPMVTSLCQSHENEHCRVALHSIYALSLFLFIAPMGISSTILLIHFNSGSQQQEQNKRIDIVVFLAALFSMPLSLCNFLQGLGYTVVSSQVVFLLTCTNSSVRPFIYFLVGSWRRHCSMESCRGHFSVGSLKKALQRVFGDTEEKTACSDDANMETII